MSCLAASACVGASIAVTPFIVHLPALAGQCLRYALAAAVLAALLPRLEPGPRRPPTPGQLVRIAVASATGSVGFNVLLVAASRRAEPAVIGAVVGASPVVLAVLGAPRAPDGRPRPRPRTLVGAVAASAGVVVVHGGAIGTGTRSTATGLLLAMAVLGCEVAFTLAVAPVLTAVGPARVSAWSCAMAAVMCAVGSAAVREPLRAPNAVEVATLAYQGLVMTALAFVLWYRGVARLGADRAGTTMAAAPVTATVTAAALGTGSLGPGTAVGALLAAVGVLVAAGSVPQRRDQRPQPRVVEQVVQHDQLLGGVREGHLPVRVLGVRPRLVLRTPLADRVGQRDADQDGG